MSICIIKHDAIKAFTSPLYGGNCRASRSGRFIPGCKTSGTHWLYCPKADQDLVMKRETLASTRNIRLNCFIICLERRRQNELA